MSSIYDGMICKIEGCSNPVRTKFLCNRHYKQIIIYGKILTRTCIDKNEIVVEGDIAKIFLYNRKREKIYEIIIDSNQKEKLEKYIWTHHSYNKNSYIYAYSNKVGLMHRFLMNMEKNDKRLIDHINLNTLDNRLCNLRFCTHQENSQNSKMRKNNKSGHKGIWWCKESKKWGASVKINEKSFFLGRFKDKEEAIQKIEEKINELHGEFSIFKHD